MGFRMSEELYLRSELYSNILSRFKWTPGGGGGGVGGRGAPWQIHRVDMSTSTPRREIARNQVNGEGKIRSNLSLLKPLPWVVGSCIIGSWLRYRRASLWSEQCPSAISKQVSQPEGSRYAPYSVSTEYI